MDSRTEAQQLAKNFYYRYGKLSEMSIQPPSSRADVNDEFSQTYSALSNALIFNNEESFINLLMQGSPISKLNSMDIVKENCLKFIQLWALLSEMSYSDKFNQLFQGAAICDCSEMVELLLKDKSLNPNKRYPYIIEKVSKFNCLKVMELLLQNERVKISSKEMDSALAEACSVGAYEIAKLLLEKKTDSKTIFSGNLANASNAGHLKIVELLLKDRRVDPTACNNQAILWASRSDPRDDVEFRSPTDGETRASMIEKAEILEHNYQQIIFLLATYKGLFDPYADDMVKLLNEPSAKRSKQLNEKLTQARNVLAHKFFLFSQSESLPIPNEIKKEIGMVLH